MRGNLIIRLLRGTSTKRRSFITAEQSALELRVSLFLLDHCATNECKIFMLLRIAQ